MTDSWHEEADDLRDQLALEARLSGWQINRTREARWIAAAGDMDRRVEVPAGWYWAAHWHPYEPPVVAADLDALEREVAKRNPPAQPRRSIMRELLTPDEIKHLEVSEGRWFLPGPPP